MMEKICQYFKINPVLIKKNHDCSTPKKCRVCYEPKLCDHICTMKKPTYPKSWPSLGFLSIEFMTDKYNDLVPLFLIVYLECKNNRCFKKFTYCDIPELLSDRAIHESFFPYYPEYVSANYETKERKQKQDFSENLKKLFRRNPENSLKIRLLQTILAQPDTTFICQDLHSTVIVSVCIEHF